MYEPKIEKVTTEYTLRGQEQWPVASGLETHVTFCEPQEDVVLRRPKDSAHLQPWHLLAQLHSNAYDISHDTSKIQLPGKTAMMYSESIDNSNVECAFVDITPCRNMGRKHWK